MQKTIRPIYRAPRFDSKRRPSAISTPSSHDADSASPLEEQAAHIVAALSDDTLEFSEAASRLVHTILRECGATACALYRSVHNTGLLVQAGRVATSKVAVREHAKLTSAMARAADAAAASFTSQLTRKGQMDHPLAMSKRVHVRTSTSVAGTTIHAMAVVRPVLHPPDMLSDIDALGVPATDPSNLHQTPLIGVWVLVVPSDDAEADARKRSRKSLDALVRRAHTFFRLLLRHQLSRDAADLALRSTEKRLREMATIYQIGKAADRVEVDGLLPLITEKAAAVMDAQACSLMLKEGNSDHLVISASFGLPDDVVENTRIFIGQGIAGRVAATGEPLLVNSDVRNDPRFAGERLSGLPGISSSIVMPMKDEWGGVLGILCIRRRTPAPVFTADDERLFSIFASQASMAIKSARLYTQLRSRVQELSTLSSLTEAISSTLDLDVVLNQVADNLLQVVGFDRCLIYLRGDDEAATTWSVPRIARGFDTSLADQAADPRFQQIGLSAMIAQIAERQLPVLAEAEPEAEAMAWSYSKALGISGFYAQPIIVRNETIGVVVVTTDKSGRTIATANIDLLATFLQHVGIAIENARLYKQMEHRVRELNTLYSMSRSLTTTYGLNRASSTVTKVASEITGSNIALLMVFNDRLDTLRIRNHPGATTELLDLLRLLPDANDVPRDVRTLREPVLINLDANPEQEQAFGASWAGLMRALAKTYPNLMLVPLVTEEANVGFLILGRVDDPPYRPASEKLVSIIASHAAAVLRSAAIYEHSVEQRVLELSALYELSRKVRTARSMTDTFDSILDIVRSVVWCDDAFVFVVDRDHRSLQVQAWHGDTAHIDSVESIDTSASIAAWVVRERKAVLTSDVTSDPRFAELYSGTSMRSLMVLPIFMGDEALAVLQVQSTTPNLYTEDNVKMLSLIAAQAAALYREMESLRELTTYTENILRSIAAGVVTMDARGGITTLNKAAERILRLRARDVVGKPFPEVVGMLHADRTDHDDTLKMVSMAIENGGTVQRQRLQYYTEPSREIPTLGQVGEPVIVNGSASQLLGERGEYLGIVMVVEDITKEQEMEQELERISRLAEIGQLAAGIAHELRNPLASIKGAAQVLKEDLPDDTVEKHGEFLDIIVNEVNVLNGVTTEFLDFSRPVQPQLKPVQLNSIISKRIAFLRGQCEQYDVAIREIYDSKLHSIKADASMFERTITNIVLNALQAMPEGGLLTVETKAVGTGSDAAVEVMFADTGIGIEPARMDSIFTPFFTTKTKGTGLGLAIVQKIIESHGGRIRVQSEPNRGTTFTVWLPVTSPFRDKVVYTSSQADDINDQRHQAASKPGSRVLDLKKLSGHG